MRKITRTVAVVAALSSLSPAVAFASLPASQAEQFETVQVAAAAATVPTDKVALVSSCRDPWYWRSLIEEFSCGLSGQGWIN